MSHFGRGAAGNTNSPRQLGKIPAAAFSPLPKQCHQPPENESSHPASKSATASCFQSITFGKELKIPPEVYEAGARCCQPAARPGERPARGLSVVGSLEAPKGLQFPLGMSPCWVPHCHQSSRATWHSPGCFIASRVALFPLFLPFF